MELYALPCDGVMAHPLRRGLPILLQKCTQSNHSLRIPRCPHRGRSQIPNVWRYDNSLLYASVAEQADAPDLKSGVRDGVRVQLPSEVPYRGVAQLVEQRSPKPCRVCSSRITPARRVCTYIVKYGCKGQNNRVESTKLQIVPQFTDNPLQILYTPICEWSRTGRVQTANLLEAGSTPVFRSKSTLCIPTQGCFLFFLCVLD